MKTSEGICAVFCHHHGFADLFPEIQFHIPGVGGCFQIAGEVVPAVIAVEADDVHCSGHKIPLIIVLAADEGYRAVLGIQFMGKFIEGMPVIVSGFRKMFGIRFVSHGPHDNTGVIFVPCDEIPQYLFMVLPDRECFIGITAFPGTDADRRCFIDDNDAFPVAEPVNFLCIGIMAGAEGIGVHPV